MSSAQAAFRAPAAIGDAPLDGHVEGGAVDAGLSAGDDLQHQSAFRTLVALCGNADDEGSAIGPALFLDAHQRIGTTLILEDEVLFVGEHVALRLTLAIGRVAGVDARAEIVGKIKLAGDEALRVEQNLEVDMRRAAWIPARIDRGEARLTTGIGELRAAQEGLPACRDAVIALAAITGIHAETVGVPEIDADAFDRRAVRGGNHLKRKRKRRAFVPFGDIGAHELGIKIERPLHRLRREDAHLGAGKCRGEALLGSGARSFCQQPIQRRASQQRRSRPRGGSDRPCSSYRP